MKQNKLYVTDMEPNGTRSLIITDEDGQVLEIIDEAVFGNLSPKKFGWSGDSLGNIDALYYGESVGMVEYSDENLDSIQNGEYSDIIQVVEVELDEVLEHIATSPVDDGSLTLKILNNTLER